MEVEVQVEVEIETETEKENECVCVCVYYSKEAKALNSAWTLSAEWAGSPG